MKENITKTNQPVKTLRKLEWVTVIEELGPHHRNEAMEEQQTVKGHTKYQTAPLSTLKFTFSPLMGDEGDSSIENAEDPSGPVMIS